MSCKSPLSSKGNTHLFLRPQGQTTWTIADRVIGANNITMPTTSTSITSEDVDAGAFNATAAGSIDGGVNFEYRFQLDAITDVVLYGAQLLREPLDTLIVFGEYPDASATSNRYYTGLCFVAGLDLGSASNSFIKHTVSLVPSCGMTSGKDLRSVDPTDAIAPTVTLASNTLTVTSDQTITLTATASDNVGVFKVEFWEGAVLLGTDFSGAFDWTIPYTSANNGNHTYTAKAFDAAGNVTTSNAVTVNVNIVASLYPAGMIYGLNMIDVVGGQLIPLPEAENQTPSTLLGGNPGAEGILGLRATWNFGDPNLLAANGSEGLTYYVVTTLGRSLGAWFEQYPILTDIAGANYAYTRTAIHFGRNYVGSGTHNLLGWALGRGGDAPAFNAASAEIVSPKPEPSAFGISSAILRVGPTFGGAPSAADLGLKATSAGGTYDQATPTITNPNPATLTPIASTLGIGTMRDNLDATNGGPPSVYGGAQKFYYLLIFRGVHDLATETAVIAQMRAELALRGVVLP